MDYTLPITKFYIEYLLKIAKEERNAYYFSSPNHSAGVRTGKKTSL